MWRPGYWLTRPRMVRRMLAAPGSLARVTGGSSAPPEIGDDKEHNDDDVASAVEQLDGLMLHSLRIEAVCNDGTLDGVQSEGGDYEASIRKTRPPVGDERQDREDQADEADGPFEKRVRGAQEHDANRHAGRRKKVSVRSDQSPTRRNLSEFPITLTLLKLIAAAAMMGDSRIPKKGESTPAATGTPSEL